MWQCCLALCKNTASTRPSLSACEGDGNLSESQSIKELGRDQQRSKPLSEQGPSAQAAQGAHPAEPGHIQGWRYSQPPWPPALGSDLSASTGHFPTHRARAQRASTGSVEITEVTPQALQENLAQSLCCLGKPHSISCRGSLLGLFGDSFIN